MSAFTPMQKFVAQHYEGGELNHIDNTLRLVDCGDTLFAFAIYEAGDAEDLDELKRMLERGAEQLLSLAGEIE